MQRHLAERMNRDHIQVSFPNHCLWSKGNAVFCLFFPPVGVPFSIFTKASTSLYQDVEFSLDSRQYDPMIAEGSVWQPDSVNKILLTRVFQL